MTLKLTVATGALLALTLATASATAQTAAKPSAGQPTGPVIPGVCTYSNERAIGSSAVGKAVGTRMQALQAAVTAELKPEGEAIQAETKTVEGLRTAQPQQYQQRGQALIQRAQAFEQKRNLRVAELQATEQEQIQRIAAELDPILKQVYAERNCGLMLDRNSLYGANPAMDVTDLVLQKLNAKITTLSFDRKRLDTQQQAAAAPKPATPAKTPAKK